MRSTSISLFLLLVLTQCADTAPSGPHNPGAVPADTAAVSKSLHTGENILNNITVKATGGLQIAAAYLTDAAGNLINTQNRISLGSPVYLTIRIKSGWKVDKGVVFPGAQQVITTSNGEPVLQSPDLFAGAKPIRAADAATLRLKAVITTTRPKIPYYVIRFRIWDKQGPGLIKGHYDLRVENLQNRRH